MSKKHPLDDTFRRKLRHYQAHAPDALWQNIDANRSWQIKAKNRFRYYKGGLALVASVVLAIGIFFLYQDHTATELGHFPINPEATTTQKLMAEVEAAATTEFSTPIPEETNIVQSNPTIENNLTPIKTSSSSSTSSSNALLAEVIPAAQTTTPSTKSIVPAEETAQEAKPQAQMATASASFAAFRALPASAIAPLETKAFATELKCVSFKTGKRHWYGEISGGATTSLRDLQAREGEFIPYARGRAATESAQLSYNTELRLSIVSPSGMAFRTGLNYTQLNEKFDYFDPDETRVTITNVTGPNGEIISRDTIIEVGIRRVETQNRYRIIDVPLVLGYELSHEKMTFAFNAGMYLNLTYRQKGDFISPANQEPVSFSSDAVDGYPAYKRQIGLGWYGSIGMYYQMNARTHIYLEPSLRMYTQSSTIEEYPLKQNYVLGSLNVGLRRVIF